MSVVSESTPAQVSGAGRQATERVRRVPGENGAWIFILGEMAVFATFIGLYLYHLVDDRPLFRVAQHHLNVTLGVVNTLILLVSSLLVVAGMRALRARATTTAPWIFGGAAVCGLAFTVIKCFEYSRHIHDHQTLSTNSFWTYFYVLTGAHLLHLLLGLAVLTFMIVEARKSRLNAEQFAYVESGACYWHMVDLIWILLFPLLYLMR